MKIRIFIPVVTFMISLSVAIAQEPAPAEPPQHAKPDSKGDGLRLPEPADQ